MKRSVVVVMLTLLAGPAAARPALADEVHPDPRVDVQSYRYALELRDDSDRIRGRADIEARVEPGVQQLDLDLVSDSGDTGMTVRALRVDGTVAVWEQTDDRLLIDLTPTATRDGFVRVEIEYDGVPADGLIIGHNLHGDRTFFGDNYPNRARNWIPSVDHPADKATVQWEVTAPARYQVVANGSLIEETDLGDGRRRTVWRTRAPLATKVMVIGVARFAVEYLGESRDTPVQSWVYPQDRETGFHAFAPAPRIVDFFVDHIGPFPYAKLANVQSKTRYGGMENAGNIFYGERAVAGGGDLEGLLAHEIAHQWFGDAVTEDDWHHVWLSEGFATYFTHLYMEYAHGAERRRQGMERDRARVLRFDSEHADSAILDDRVAVEHILSANAYQKGGWVLHMLRHELGDETFWKGIRAYYRRYRDGNALTGDFRDVMEAVSGKNLHAFFAQWTQRPGQPTLGGSWSWSDGVLRVRLEQTQEAAPFGVNVDVGIRAADGELDVHTMHLADRAAELQVDVAARPAAVVLDPGVWLLYRPGEMTEVDAPSDPRTR